MECWGRRRIGETLYRSAVRTRNIYVPHQHPRGARRIVSSLAWEHSPVYHGTVTSCGTLRHPDRSYGSASTWNMNSSHNNIRRTRTRGLSTLIANEEEEANKNDNHHDAIPPPAVQAQLLLDVFGEPVTFLRNTHNKDDDGGDMEETHARTVLQGMADLDTFAMAVVSRGQSCREGNSGNGLTTQAAHSTALAHTRLLRHSVVQLSTNGDSLSSLPRSPMMAVVGVAPLLCQGGLGYVSHLDQLLAQSTSPSIQLVPWARWAASFHKDEDSILSDRERGHLQALHYLLAGQHDAAGLCDSMCEKQAFEATT